MYLFGKDRLVFGIFNLTPDSFSGGDLGLSFNQGLERLEGFLEAGADFVDIGGESTRPGAKAVSPQDEWGRVGPFLEFLKSNHLAEKISIDTRNFEIMEAACLLGVSFINCVGEIPSREQLMKLKKIKPNLRFIACHMHGTPESMQKYPLNFSRSLDAVEAYYQETRSRLLNAGYGSEDIYLDPGIGFGKTDDANWGLIFQTPKFSERYNIALGVSRKGFIGRALNISAPVERDPATKILECQIFHLGAKIIRTHNVKLLQQLRTAVGGGLAL